VIKQDKPQTLRGPGSDPDAYDLRTAIAVKLGFGLLGTPATGPPIAENWTFSFHENTSALTDPTGTVLAEFETADDPQWRAQFERCTEIVVIYGIEIGVRCPKGTPEDSYDDQTRAEELSSSRRAGTATWGIVRS
jgi:hypothetical protein